MKQLVTEKNSGGKIWIFKAEITFVRCVAPTMRNVAGGERNSRKRRTITTEATNHELF